MIVEDICVDEYIDTMPVSHLTEKAEREVRVAHWVDFISRQIKRSEVYDDMAINPVSKLLKFLSDELVELSSRLGDEASNQTKHSIYVIDNAIIAVRDAMKKFAESSNSVLITPEEMERELKEVYENLVKVLVIHLDNILPLEI